MSARLARPRALLFDWDNTLVDNWGAIHVALNATLVAMGQREWSYEETRLRVRRSMRETFPEMFGDRWRQASEVFYATFEARHIETLRIMPGAGHALERLQRAGLYLGVVSNKSGPLLRREAAHLGWTAHFGRLVGAGDAPRDKPAPDPVHLALAPADFPPGPDIWFVGDAYIDLDCARRAGCAAVLVGPGKGEAAEIDRLGPEGRVGDLAGLLDLVEAGGLTLFDKRETGRP